MNSRKYRFFSFSFSCFNSLTFSFSILWLANSCLALVSKSFCCPTFVLKHLIRLFALQSWNYKSSLKALNLWINTVMTEMESSKCDIGGLRYISSAFGTCLSIRKTDASEWQWTQTNLSLTAGKINECKAISRMYTMRLNTVVTEKVTTGGERKDEIHLNKL